MDLNILCPYCKGKLTVEVTDEQIKQSKAERDNLHELLIGEQLQMPGPFQHPDKLNRGVPRRR